MKAMLKAGATIVAVAVAASAAPAHHSFAMFDRSKEVELSGVVKEFQWTNPHIWIQLLVSQNGKQVMYGIEGSSPNGLRRRGWTRTSFNPGDKVAITINPLKSGEPGGSFVSAKTSNGALNDQIP